MLSTIFFSLSKSCLVNVQKPQKAGYYSENVIVNLIQNYPLRVYNKVANYCFLYETEKWYLVKLSINILHQCHVYSNETRCCTFWFVRKISMGSVCLCSMAWARVSTSGVQSAGLNYCRSLAEASSKWMFLKSSNAVKLLGVSGISGPVGVIRTDWKI